MLKRGGRLLAGFCLPVLFLVDEEKDEKGEIVVRYKIPYSDTERLLRGFLGAGRERDLRPHPLLRRDLGPQAVTAIL